MSVGIIGSFYSPSGIVDPRDKDTLSIKIVGTHCCYAGIKLIDEVEVKATVDFGCQLDIINESLVRQLLSNFCKVIPYEVSSFARLSSVAQIVIKGKQFKIKKTVLLMIKR